MNRVKIVEIKDIIFEAVLLGEQDGAQVFEMLLEMGYKGSDCVKAIEELNAEVGQ